MSNYIFLQARINSRRFPKKVLKKIFDKTIIELIVERLNKIKNIKKIVLVTGPENKNSDLIVEVQKLNLDYFCGSEENILDRFYQASKMFNPDNIIRVTADCPLIDFNLVNKGLKIFSKENYDILSVDRVKTYPHGVNFQIFSNNALEKAWLEIKNQFKDNTLFLRSFIPPISFMLEDPQFRKYDLINKIDNSHIRIVLDYPEDFELIKKIYESLYEKNRFFDLSDVLKFLKNNQHLLEINKKYVDLTHGYKFKK